MDTRTLTTTSPEETKQFGRDLARELAPGTVVLLRGDLGAGKTTLVQGIAEGLGAITSATSPSFVIMNEYPLGSRPARSATHSVAGGQEAVGSNGSVTDATASVLRHLDLYRLPEPSIDIDRIGLPELLNDPHAITIIEWADRLPKELAPDNAVVISLVHGEQEGERRIEIQKNKEGRTE